MDSVPNYLSCQRFPRTPGWMSACAYTTAQEYCFQVLLSQPGTNCLSLDLRPDRASHRAVLREIAPFAPPTAPSWPVASFCVVLSPLAAPLLSFDPSL